MSQMAWNWFFWALLSAVFAALTAIFAKIGILGVDSDNALDYWKLYVVYIMLGKVKTSEQQRR